MAIGTPVSLGVVDPATSITSGVLTTGADSPAGNLIVLCGNSNVSSTQMTSASDSAGNAYAVMQLLDASSPGISMLAQSNAVHLPSGGTITFNFAGTTHAHAIGAFTCSGISQASEARNTFPVAVSGTGTSISTLSSMRANPQSLMVAMISASASMGTFTPGGSWTQLMIVTTNAFMRVYYQIVTDGSLVSFAPSWVNSVNWKARIANFNALLTPYPQYESLVGVLT